jgi:secreted trypsin-like serine protease
VNAAGRGRKALACALALGVLWAYAAPGSAAAAKAKPSVAGGVPASLADYGFTVAILQDGRFICSGSVISPTRILTAAHCVTVAASRLAVVAGRTSLGGSGGEVLPVSGASRHPESNIVFRNDLAVLALGTPTTSPPVKLATAEEDAATTSLGSTLTVAGFGRRNVFGFGKPRLGSLYATNLFSRPGCKKYRGRFFPAEMICANGRPFRRLFRLKLMRTACPGDSGGPLLANTPSGPRQVGVVSFGVSTPFILCGEKGFPGVFTRVSFFGPFLAPYAAG